VTLLGDGRGGEWRLERQQGSGVSWQGLSKGGSYPRGLALNWGNVLSPRAAAAACVSLPFPCASPPPMTCGVQTSSVGWG
jgi:hypothetical protein